MRLSVSLVGSSSGVEARTQTSPVESLMAVERPPMGIMPKREKGLGAGGRAGRGG